MGVFGAMLTAVSGLRSQAYALENISGNIANSQTTGFKRVDTSFVDLIPDLPPRQALAGSVAAFSRGTNTIQGDFNTTGVGTHIAINGQGYFAVAQRSDFIDGNPVFTNQQFFTRRGDFEIDRDGYLINGAGYYLRGNSIDPVTGATLGTAGGPIQISNDPIPASQTTEIEYRANLPLYPVTRNADRDVPQSELLQPAGYTVDPTAGTVDGADESLFINDSVSGGSITVYNSIGAAVNVQLRWAKTDAAVYGGTDTWQLFYQSNSNATAGQTAWTSVGTYTFGASGGLTSAPTVTATGLTVNGVVVGDIDITSGPTGLTQFDNANGIVEGSDLRQDGYAAGTLERIAITNEGQISGTYSNGQVVTLAEISIANFNADNALQRLDGGVFAQTLESGPPIIGIGTSNILGGTLENSNTDIAEEFSKMIITQQAYSANTRVVTTAQQMLADVINIIR